MATKGISYQLGRFAALKVEDDDDEIEQESKAKQTSKNQQQNASAKKRNKKKKKAEAASEDAQLRNLAFGKPASGKSRPNKGGGDSRRNPSDRQWEQWKKTDAELIADTYERELQQAILQSKLEFEEKKEEAVTVANEEVTKGKEKKKKKKNTMTLEEFNQLPPEKPKGSDSEEEYEFMPAKKLETKIENPDPTFFDSVEQDAQQMIRKEIIQEEYRKQYVIESAQALKNKEEIEKRDKEIERLTKENKTLSDEYKEVKKRNQQLCHILAQGEMKDKRAVLQENDELKGVQQELTSEVGELTRQLEKERSTVHALREELNKLKGGKQSGR